MVNWSEDCLGFSWRKKFFLLGDEMHYSFVFTMYEQPQRIDITWLVSVRY